jgi:hypothetical protein
MKAVITPSANPRLRSSRADMNLHMKARPVFGTCFSAIDTAASSSAKVCCAVAQSIEAALGQLALGEILGAASPSAAWNVVGVGV